jgi:hypothetical protein
MRSFLVLACLLLCSVPGSAQEIDSIDYLPSVLAYGERVIVTGATCQAAEAASPLAQQPCLAEGAPATIRGKVEQLGDGFLVIAASGRRYTFPLESVDRIERSKDRIWNGALIGYGVGVAIGVIGAFADECRVPPGAIIDLCSMSGPGFGLVIGGIITGPIGFGIGALADAGISRPRLVFASSKSSGLSRATPGLSHRGAGLAVSVAF